MRWFCVAPDLPAKASLRIRAAPNGDADVCGRFSKGKAVAALSSVFQIAADENESGELQHWLHVTFPEETSGEWIEGFVMTQLPNGMTLLVPWEDAGFYNCCNIMSDRAIVYEGPEPTAQAVGYVGEGEGTRFPYGVREVDGDRLRIFHDVHERVWVDAADVELVCERFEHPKCTVSHSFFALNEELPPEAQIAVRVFPSREAETRALLNRGQVIEVEMRCGSWLKIAGSSESWIMWRTDTWQLLTEYPHHSSGSCVLVGDVDMGGEQLQDGTEGEPPQTVADSHGMEADIDPSTDASPTLNGTAVDLDPSRDHEQETRKNSSSVTSLCDGLASHDISGHDENMSVDVPAHAKNEAPLEDHATVTLPWDETPLDVKTDTQLEPSNADDAIDVIEGHYGKAKSHEADKVSSESASWEDRPISTTRGAYEGEDRPLTVKSRTQSNLTAVEDASQEAEEVTEDVPVQTVESTPASSSWEDRPISSSRGNFDWDEQPLNVKSQTQSDLMEVEDEQHESEMVAEDAVPGKTVEHTQASSSWEDRPTSSSRGAYDREDRPLNVRNGAPSDHMDVEDMLRETEDMLRETEEIADGGASLEVVEPSPASPSWDDRPISSNRGACEWEEQPPNVKAQPDHEEEESVLQGSEVVPEDNVSVEVVEPTPSSSSWEDRPISSSRGTYNWEAEYAPPADTPGGKTPSSTVHDGTLRVQEDEESSAHSDKNGVLHPSVQLSCTIDSALPIDETGTSSSEAGVVSEHGQPSEKAYSWEDRPITKSRGAYDWESAFPPPAEKSVGYQAESKIERVDPQAEGNEPRKVSSPTTVKSHSALSQEESANLSGKAGAHDDEPKEGEVTEGENKEWHWEEAPIKSRHARKAAFTDSEGDASSVTVEVTDGEDVAAAWADARPAWSARRRPKVGRDDEQRESTTAKGESPAKRAAVGVVSSEGTSVAWHSIAAAEEPGAFEESDGVTTQVSTVETKKYSPAKHSPNRIRHSPAPAVGVVSSDTSSVTWHSNDAAEDPGVFDNDVGDEPKVSRANATISMAKTAVDTGSAHDTMPVSHGSSEVHDENARGEGHDQESNLLLDQSDEPYESTLGTSPRNPQVQEPEDMDVEDDEPGFVDCASSVEDGYNSGVPLLAGTDDEADFYDFVGGNEKLPVLEERNPAVPIDWRDYSARLRGIFQRESRNHLDGSRILRAIALDEGADAILEALATTGEFDEELLKYEAPPSVGTRIAPSPSTSESGLLDVLYSRDQDDGFSTPKKRLQGHVKSTPQSKEERLADILRRTPQKAAESHSKIVNNARPEDILEAEFGGCSDDLGLFGDYRYPTVSTPRFSTGILGSSTRTVSAFGSLQSPSFTSSSFNSPPPKENPLKRSASAIAKTPPVILPKSVAASKPVMPSVPKPVLPAPTPESVQVPAPSMPPPPPVRTKTTPSSLLPPSARTATGLPRPSLMSPSTLNSRLRAPSAAGATNPTPSVSRARSFTTNNDVRATATVSTPTPSMAAPPSGLARTQSMLPRRSALQAPSPIKFGITRTNSLASSTAPPPAADAAVDPRRLSFGFSRPSTAKKQ